MTSQASAFAGMSLFRDRDVSALRLDGFAFTNMNCEDACASHSLRCIIVSMRSIESEDYCGYWKLPTRRLSSQRFPNQIMRFGHELTGLGNLIALSQNHERSKRYINVKSLFALNLSV
ncbi:uncharacterized protein PHALS_08187 [Plasmopara halstedii]|uniref:Uncharacterized protein n=1 Tax=Plasmopara halstedii TaxID=4781 RepID=A0A0P1AB14_PLAHL|nr:uncharacterized protein PHALS_08187 [Plasmopara halstedii]CEG38093.1 hypothetical protein PHALS_08187 [Plasmopara halstedii]|eukprot:XP_024574462.1 hypothetical protein PHALS_08187 [Plasmopara halstedii]